MKTYDHSDALRDQKFVRSPLFAGIVRVPAWLPILLNMRIDFLNPCAKIFNIVNINFKIWRYTHICQHGARSNT